MLFRKLLARTKLKGILEKTKDLKTGAVEDSAGAGQSVLDGVRDSLPAACRHGESPCGGY